jgi:hypothetical protein
MLRTTLKCDDGGLPITFAVLTDYQEWRAMLCPAVEKRFVSFNSWPVGEVLDGAGNLVFHPFPVLDEDKWLASRAGTRNVYVFLVVLHWDTWLYSENKQTPGFYVVGPREVLSYWGVVEPGNADAIWIVCDRYHMTPRPFVSGWISNPLTHRTFVPSLARCRGDSLYGISTTVSADMSYVVPPQGINKEGRMGYNWQVRHGMFRRMNQRNTEPFVRGPDPKTGAGMRILEPSVEEIRMQIQNAAVGAKSAEELKQKLLGLNLSVNTSDDKTHVLSRTDYALEKLWRTFVWDGDPMDLMLADCSSISARTINQMQEYMSAKYASRHIYHYAYWDRYWGITEGPPVFLATAKKHEGEDIASRQKWWIGRKAKEPNPGDPVGYSPYPRRLPRAGSFSNDGETNFYKCDKYARATIEDPSAPAFSDGIDSFAGVVVNITYEVELRISSGVINTLFLILPHFRTCFAQVRKVAIDIGVKWPDPPLDDHGRVVADALHAKDPYADLLHVEDQYNAYALPVLTWRPDKEPGFVEHLIVHGKLKYAQRVSYLEQFEAFGEAKSVPFSTYKVLPLKSQYHQDVDAIYAGAEMDVAIRQWPISFSITATFIYPPDLTPGMVVGEYRHGDGRREPVVLGNTLYKEYWTMTSQVRRASYDAPIGNGAGLEIWPEHASRMYLFNNPALVQTEGRPLTFTWEPFS